MAKPSKCLIKHSIVIRGQRTAISLEDEFWHEIKWLAIHEGIKRDRFVTLGELIAEIDDKRSKPGRLSGAIRVHCLNEAKRRAQDPAFAPRSAVEERVRYDA